MLKQRGFTMVELMITVALIGIISAVVIPGYRTFIAQLQINNTANLVHSAAQSARSEAIKINGRVSLVRSGTTNQWCLIDRTVDILSTTCDTSSNTLENGIIKKFIDPSQTTTLTILPAGANQITYNSLGQIINNVDNSAPITSVAVTLTDVENKEMRVQLDTGKVRLCDPNKPTGDPQKC